MVSVFSLNACKEEVAEETTAVEEEEPAAEEEEPAAEEEEPETTEKWDGVYDPTVPVNDGKPITISIWDLNNRPIFYGRWLDEYTSIHPNVTIELNDNMVPDQEGLIKLVESRKAGKGPDLCYASTNAQTYVNPVSTSFPEDIMPEEALEKYMGNLDMYKVDGEIYYVPLVLSTLVMYYNKTFWQEEGLTESDFPKTWGELVEVAKKLTKYDDQGEVVRSGLGAVGENTNIFLTMLYTQGKFWFNEDGSRTNFDSPEAIKGLQWIHDLYYLHKVDNKDFPPSHEMFGSGKSAIAIGGTWYDGYLERTHPELEYGSFMIPSWDGKTAPAYYLKGLEYSWGVDKFASEENQAVAWDFIKFVISTPEAMIDLVKDTGGVSGRTDLWGDPRLEREASAVMAGFIDRTVVSGNFPVIFWYTIIDAVTELRLTEKSPEDTAKDMQEVSDEAFADVVEWEYLEPLYEYADEMRH